MKWPSFIPRNKFQAGGYAGDQEKTPGGFQDSPVPFLTWRSFVLGAFVSIGGIIFGYDTGQISGFLEMDNFKQRFGQLQSDGTYKFSNVRSGLIVALISSPAPKWYQIMMGRFVTGFGVGACSLLVPMYQGESAPRQVRGAMVCSYQLFVTLGIFVAYCINFGTESLDSSASWRIPLGITFLWGLILGIGIIFFPESPRYDFRHGRIDRAKKTMTKLYGVPESHRVIQDELAEIKDQLEAENAGRGGWHGWVEMWQGPRMPYRIFLGVALQALQQLTGANYFFYYGTVIFNGAGISNTYVTQMILGGVNFGTTFGGLYVVEHFGRRKSLIVGGLWMFVCFMVFASVGHFSLDVQNPPNTPGAGKAMVVFACLFITGFAMTWGPMVWTICAELYPSRYRAKAMSLSTASNWLWNFLIGFFTPFITADIDFAYGYVFAGCLIVAVFVVYFFVLEGRGKTLEEMDMMYIMRVPPWKSSHWVPPPPEHQVTTAHVLDRRTAQGFADEDESNKRNTQHGMEGGPNEQDAGPSST
ncbi:hexose transporter hxt1 [Aspergillus nanangensis]|uniref:Hexose transporter hxt1 n=1 Tax=Aspergillus nanangensis TaxID=2582783 RepID=A0AAD4GP57_ASPNN|nr:hexose transporter hxt1 [Aspergillus nanangensis]